MKTANELASKAWHERSAHEGLSEREACRLVDRAQEDAWDDGARAALAAVRKILAALTPTIAPVIVWVVETGMPKLEAMNKVIAPPVSAAKPPTGLSLVIF